MARTAAALIIGNEILTGKIAEGNVHVMAKEFFGMGVELQRIIVCADVIDIIADDVNALRGSHDVVITTGGVGPTHDDVTMHAVAQAFGVGIVRSPEYEKLFRDYHGEETTEAHLRMADIPEGARLAVSEEINWPTVVMGNVYVFPGVPQLFKMKFGLLRKELKNQGGFASKALYLNVDERFLAVAEKLAQTPASLRPGKRRVTVQSQGYFPHDLIVELVPGVTTVEITLRPVPP
jgi:molybdopterin-biosynthesis enzyme MoeA-like protein